MYGHWNRNGCAGCPSHGDGLAWRVYGNADGILAVRLRPGCFARRPSSAPLDFVLWLLALVERGFMATGRVLWRAAVAGKKARLASVAIDGRRLLSLLAQADICPGDPCRIAVAEMGDGGYGVCAFGAGWRLAIRAFPQEVSGVG